jgi:tol-pal system protein YbgF
MRYLFFLLVCFLLVGCASTDELTNVKTDVSSVYQDFAADRQEKNDRIAKIEKDMDGLRKQFLDLSISLEARDDKIKTILGRIDELESQLRTYWEETKAQMKEVKKGRGETGPGPVKSTGEEQYKAGFDAFQRGAYQEGIAKLTDFIKVNPDNPLVPNAFYWTGEAYMNLQDQEKAIVNFQEVIDKYPSSEKAPRALLRQAEAFGILGDKKSSTTLMKRVIELYPKSEEARIAERQLKNSGL